VSLTVFASYGAGVHRYMFLRMLSMFVRFCVIVWLVAMVAVLPTYLAGADDSQEASTAVSVENLPDASDLLWITVLMAYFVNGLAMYMIHNMYLEVRASMRLVPFMCARCVCVEAVCANHCVACRCTL